MATPVNVGDVLAGKYQVEAILGEGGMGVVVAARHLMLGERVAIKFLLPQSLSRDDVVARFLREGQAAARIRSEHVARVYDVGTLAHGEPYLVMEHLEGADLGVLLRTHGRLQVGVACDYVLQACDALAEAHALGIVHRDLKPGNLFVARRADGTPIVKIIDFGISKVALTAESGASRGGDMTQSSIMMGSPLYMSPEQMISSKNVDARSDIWSLGVLLHQLLTGATPFNGETIMEIYDRILQGPPPIRAARPDVPERVEQAVLRCLRRNVTERFNNVAELAAELAPFAPPHTLVLVERAARVLRVRVAEPAPDAARLSSAGLGAGLGAGPGAGPGAPRGSSPPPADGARVSGVGVAASSGWGTEPSAGGDIGLARTDRSWGGTRPPTLRKHTRRLAIGLVGGALFLVCAGGGAWLAFPRGGPESAAPIAATPPPGEPAPGASPAAPSAAAIPGDALSARGDPTPAPAPPPAPSGATAAGLSSAAPVVAGAARVAGVNHAPSASSPAPLQPGTRLPPSPRPPPRPQDLFGDPR